MKRIDSPGHVGNLFSNGDPQLGIRATVLDPEWLNNVQEEVVNTIEGAGLTLDGSSTTQLRDAIGRQAFGVNVKNFGAVGDGINDDAFAFQAAQNHIDAIGRGRINVPKGEYRIGTTTNQINGIDGTSIIVGSNTHWRAERGAKIISGARNSSFGNNCFLIRNAKNVLIEGFAADGQATSPTDRPQVFVAMEGVVERVALCDLSLRNFANFAIVYGDQETNPDFARFDNVLIRDIDIGGVTGLEGDGSGINFFPRSSRDGIAASRNLRLYNITVDVSNGSKVALEQGPQGIKINNVDGVTLDGCVCTGGRVASITVANGCRHALVAGRGRNSSLGLNITTNTNATTNETKYIMVRDWQFHADGFDGPAVGMRILGAVRGLVVPSVAMTGASMLIADNYANDLLIGDVNPENWTFGAISIVNGSLNFAPVSNAAQPPLEGAVFQSLKLTGTAGENTGRVLANGWKLKGCWFGSISADKVDGNAVTLSGEANRIGMLTVINGNPNLDSEAYALNDFGLNNTVDWIRLGGEAQNMTHFYNASNSLGGLTVRHMSGTAANASAIRITNQEATRPFKGQRQVMSREFVLEDAAETEIAMLADRDYYVAGVQVLYTEATSSDAGVLVRVGSGSGGLSHFVSITTDASAAAGASVLRQNTTGTNAFSTRYLAEGDTLTFRSEGGKTGSGRVKIIVNLIEGD